MEKSKVPSSRARLSPGEEIKSCSSSAMLGINAEKSMIADMRPARRKIKWNSAVSDWDRRGDQTSTRIKVGIDLEELQLLGGVPLIQPQKELLITREESYNSLADLSFAEGDAVDVLEKKIQRIYDTIQRIADENDKLDEEVEQLEEQNQILRQEIAAAPMGKHPTRKGLEQLCKLETKLRKKLRELDRQCKLLNRRKNEIEQTKRRLRSDEGLDETKSYSTQTSKSISTFVDADDGDTDEEDIVVFSKEGESDSDSDSDFDTSSSEEEAEKIKVDAIEENEEEDGDTSLGSLQKAEEEELSEFKSGLHDSLRDLPFEPTISLL